MTRWSEIAKNKSIDDIKECIYSGYKSGRPFEAEKIHFIKPNNNLQVLDFGCGLGRNFRTIGEFGEVDAYDLPEMIQRLNETVSAKVARSVYSDFDKLKQNKYDIGFCILSLQQFEDAQELKQKIIDISNICSYIYIVTRSYMDDHLKSNVIKIIDDADAFDLVMSNLNHYDFKNKKDETHGLFIYKSKNCEGRLDIIPPTLENIKSSHGDFVYVSYARAIQDIKYFCQSLKDISAVAGIPRSGCFIASVIAHTLNIPLLSLEGLRFGSSSRPNGSRPINIKSGKILIVDDTSSSGSCMKSVKKIFGNDFLYGALYCLEEQVKNLDRYYSIIPTGNHTFEWNFMRDILTAHSMTDMDGVICEDWIGVPEESGGIVREDYLHFLENTQPLYLPKYPVYKIVTARLEKFRRETEEWLRKHNVQYTELVMSPYDTAEERMANNGFGDWKSSVYKSDDHAKIFYESEHNQALSIYSNSGKPVFCTDTLTAFGAMEF